jgi:non-lysosomal glucosylceramidase
MGDQAFAAECRTIFERGQRHLVSRLFDGEYFINRPDITHLDTINSGNGCEIDQVFGQSWATQLHLGRVLPKRETSAALRALWKYNFTPDVGPYREKHKPGRWYAVAGEAGMLMCTFPRADWQYAQASGKGPEELAGYFNECWPGQEYQVAGHMISEGLVTEGLAVTRAVHDRHHAARRNPWNEIECGDHYVRSMSSYGVFLAACGYEYHGPQGYLAFAPRLSPEDFKTAFTTAQGWGSFTQKIYHDRIDATIALKWGSLRLQTLGLAPQTLRVESVKAMLNGRVLRVTTSFEEEQLRVNFTAPLLIQAGQTLTISVRKADLSATARKE